MTKRRAPETGRLVPLVAQEARRVLSEARLEPNPARLAAGWERRFVADAIRAAEAAALYEQLGYEVTLDPLVPEQLDDDCSDCVLRSLLDFRTIYVRRRARALPAEEPE